jgi:ribosome-binding ATPase YchF (GTP1/OBG family)
LNRLRSAPTIPRIFELMKISLFGIADIKLGRHNVKEPRLDEADRLVEADKKTYAQVEVVDQSGLADCDAILAHQDCRADLILMDLEFVETRLGRNPTEAERTVLEKLRTALESDRFVSAVPLSEEEKSAIAAHAFVTTKPITLALPEELAQPEKLILRCVREAGYMFFLTVGGKENRAWLIRKGVTAWEAAGAIHTDIQKGFIRAEVIGWNDFVEAGGETQAKRAGKQRLEMKAYEVQDCDLMNFRFNK